MDRSQLESQILQFGTEIFHEVQGDRLSIFDSELYTGKLMEWAMRDDEFKVALFRFVDVLPALESSSAVIAHAQEYFRPVAHRIPGLLKWGLDVDPNSIPAKLAAQVIRKQIRSMAERFIVGEEPHEALKALRQIRKDGLCFTVDLLGEATVGESESLAYMHRYLQLLETLHEEVPKWKEAAPLIPGHKGETTPINISVKLSALYSQSHALNHDRAVKQLGERFAQILSKAKEVGAFVYMDMEDTKLTSITLDTFRSVLESQEFKNYERCGVVLQAYLRRSEADLSQLIEWAKRRGTPVAVRLVKGAYWDTETLIAKQFAWEIPVWQEKAASDACYERMTDQLLASAGHVLPAFASHNIRSLVHAVKLAEAYGVPKTDFELQALYGMAEPVKKAFVKRGYLVREYSPIGELIPGMGYLVRRLLENTSNEGFLRLGFHEHERPERLLQKPQPQHSDTGFEHLDEYRKRPFANVGFLDFSEAEHRAGLSEAIQKLSEELRQRPVDIAPIVDGETLKRTVSLASTSPEDAGFVLARVSYANTSDVVDAIGKLAAFGPQWRKTPVADRAAILKRAAELMRIRRHELSATMVLEAGKEWLEADADVAEAIDFLNYYADEAIQLFTPKKMGDYPGEQNWLTYEARGVTSVICPWNFPLAIPCGMFAAALVTGNVAALKPSGLTCLIAKRLFDILVEAGLPLQAAAFLPCSGADAGEKLVSDPRVNTIVFTGSKEVGLTILEKAALVARGQLHVKRAIIEMGGKNAIIVDEDADLDEAIKGVVYSAFGFQGQKCSACSRVIVVGDAYEKFTVRLADAVRALIVGPATDGSSAVGPVIDAAAASRLLKVIDDASQNCNLLAQAVTPNDASAHYVPPTVFTDVPRDHQIAREELFGPILAVFRVGTFDEAIELANDSEFGLTGAVFSRSPAHLEQARSDFAVGNLYINRGSTGALVMRQPFGGAKMSGMGSKAGGPDYLLQFVIPKAISENTIRRGFAPVNT